MDTVAEFRRHAEKCLRMSQSTANFEEKSSWHRFADRWLRCAEQAEREEAVARAVATERTVTYRQNRLGERSERAA
jgi:hypothetical protein